MTAPVTSSFDIIRFQGTEPALLDDLYAGYAAAFPLDHPDEPMPDREAVGQMLANKPHGLDAEFYAAHVDGRCAGFALLFLPRLDNTHLVNLELVVFPEHRRRGVGRLLADLAEQRTRELGRTTIVSRTAAKADGTSPGPYFAEAVGAEAAMTEVVRRLDLSDVDESVYAALLADCRERSAGYEIVQWTDGVDGPTPEEYVDDLALLVVRLELDAPKGGLNMEASAPDPDMIRTRTHRNGRAGIRQIHTGVRDRASGRIVAWSALTTMAADRGYGQQGVTVVDPAHRGLRLGTLVKLENLSYARSVEPLLRLIETSNAGENRHMIAINEALGFRVRGRIHNFQKEL